MKEYLKFMSEFIGGLILYLIGLIIFVRQVKESKKDMAFKDEYGNRIKIYGGAIIFMIVGLAIFLRAL